MRYIRSLVLSLFNNRRLILDMVRNDFTNRFAGSFFSFFWSFINPLVTVLIFWFVFQVGFKAAPVQNVPYIIWLLCGLIPWFFYSDGLGSVTGCINEYSYLVKKVVFKVEFLPIIKILSSLIVHVFFIALIIYVFEFYSFEPDLYYLQIIYYIFCNVLLIIGLSYIFSSLNVFFKDMSPLVGIILQITMWTTPIMWSRDIVPKKLSFILYLNPVLYVVDGIRDTFINKIWFWQKPLNTIYFWGICIFILYIGLNMFKKLKIHFSDVL